MPGVAIRVANPISSYERSTVTDSKGEFRFGDVPPNGYHLTAVKDGFQAHEDDVAVRTMVPVTLEIKMQIQGAATTLRVEAYGADVLENVPYAHYDTDRAAFSRLPVTTPASGLSDAITMAAPSVVADSNGFFHPLGDHAQASFIVDGQPITDQQSKQFSTQLPANAIQSMELITGGVNAEYGDKTSLVANTQTRTGLGSQGTHGAVSARYGSFGSVGQDFDLGVGTETVGNFLVVNSERSGRFLDTPEFRPYHAVGNAGVSFNRFDYRLSDHHAFYAKGFGARNWFQTPNSLDNLSQDQRQKVETWSFAPGYTWIADSHTVANFNLFTRQDRVNYYPSRDPADDVPATISQKRNLLNVGGRGDVSYVRGHNTLKIGFQVLQNSLTESFFLEGPEIDRIDFYGTRKINQQSAYVQDSFALGGFTLSGGFRVDRYDGFSKATGFQPRGGISYLVEKTGTIFRFAYSNTFETPYNENLVLASSGDMAIQPGRRNQVNAGIQQAIGRWVQIDADYFWKRTDSAYDFAVLYDTPITFPISWAKSKIDGFAVRIATANWKGLQAYTLMGSSRARFFGPANGGLILDEGSLEEGVFRIDHDQKFQQTTFVRYQYKKGPWAAFTWRYDNGLVAGAVADPDEVLELSGARQSAMGLYCGNTFAAPGMPITACNVPLQAKRIRLPAPGTFDPDRNPPRISPRHLFNASIGTDNLFNRERYRTSLKFTVVNMTNKEALYNFLSTFSGTHFVTPRAYTAELGFRF